MNTQETPLVTAIMPTKGRTLWAQQAVQSFLAQTWPNKQLVAVDEVRCPSYLNPHPDNTVFSDGLTIGAKRNLAIEQASGEIIIHWDDDDISRPDRIEHQVGLLIKSGAELVGYNRMNFWDINSGELFDRRCAPYYAIGSSMCYWKRIWNDRPFPDKNVGEDNEFQSRRFVLACDSAGRMIARIHDGNTNKTRESIEKYPDQWPKASAA
jgi:glycosyltransferase involved in cell wall biosynthesis